MIDWSGLALRFEAVSQELCAEHALQAQRIRFKLFPQAHEHNGFFFSDFAIQLASILKIAPAAVATQLFARLPSELRDSIALENGYLNFLDLKELLKWSVLSPQLLSQQGERVRIIIVRPYQGFSGFSHLRLLCSAIFQYSILKNLGAQVLLSYADEELILGFDHKLDLKKILQLCLQDLQLIQCPQAKVEQDLMQVMDGAAQYDWQMLWIYPPHFQNLGAFLNKENSAEVANVSFLQREWLFDYETALKPENLSRLDSEELLAFFLYICSPVLAADFDLTLCAQSTRANVAWYLKASRQRFLAASSAELSWQELLQDPYIFQSSAAFAFLQLHEFKRVAGRHGLSAQYLAAIDYQLSLLNAQLNRQQVEIGLLPVASKIVSDIIAENEILNLTS